MWITMTTTAATTTTNTHDVFFCMSHTKRIGVSSRDTKCQWVCVPVCVLVCVCVYVEKSAALVCVWQFDQHHQAYMIRFTIFIEYGIATNIHRTTTAKQIINYNIKNGSTFCCSRQQLLNFTAQKTKKLLIVFNGNYCVYKTFDDCVWSRRGILKESETQPQNKYNIKE